ncbi:MAG: hypothetical protein JO275_02445 [Verrucomicrobia bacterium]|nr:hypothetical protein [Verrucomicrobiota bacterium]
MTQLRAGFELYGMWSRSGRGSSEKPFWRNNFGPPQHMYTMIACCTVPKAASHTPHGSNPARISVIQMPHRRRAEIFALPAARRFAGGPFAPMATIRHFAAG